MLVCCSSCNRFHKVDELTCHFCGATTRVSSKTASPASFLPRILAAALVVSGIGPRAQAKENCADQPQKTFAPVPPYGVSAAGNPPRPSIEERICLAKQELEVVNGKLKALESTWKERLLGCQDGEECKNLQEQQTALKRQIEIHEKELKNYRGSNR